MTHFPPPELVEKAKAAASAEQLLEIAKAAGVEMTPAEAATYFAQLNPKSGELDDDDLDNVAGGACATGDPTSGERVRVTSGQTCPKCGTNIGLVMYGGAYLGTYVRCEPCEYNFASDERDGTLTYEIIG